MPGSRTTIRAGRPGRWNAGPSARPTGGPIPSLGLTHPHAAKEHKRADTLSDSSRAERLVRRRRREPYRQADLSYFLGKICIMTNELARAQQELNKFLALALALDKPVSQAHALIRVGTV